MLYFSNKIIVLEIIKSKKWKRLYMMVFGAEAGFIMAKTFIFSDYFNFENVILSTMVVFGVAAFFIINVCFLVCIYNLSILNKELINIQLMENEKYKHMFNSLQDAIFHI